MFKLKRPTLGGLDCQEDAGVGGEESLEGLEEGEAHVEWDLEAVLGRVEEIRRLVGIQMTV